jgi:hypothetical protein
MTVFGDDKSIYWLIFFTERFGRIINVLSVLQPIIP